MSMAETEEYLMTLLDEAERNIISDPLGEIIEPCSYRLRKEERQKENADFYAECAEKGATFLLTSPPVYENNIGSTQEELEAFDAWARSVFDAPIICEKWSDGFVAYEDLYDGVRHLNSAGASAYTQNLYEDLLPYLT